MTQNEFLELLKKSSNQAIEFAKEYVTDELKSNYLYNVFLCKSDDDPKLIQFDIYSEEKGKTKKHLTDIELSKLILRKNKVPVWVDISVSYVEKEKTVFNLNCACRFSDDENEFYYVRNGTGPFGVKSPVLPAYFEERQKFKLNPPISKTFWSRLKELFSFD